MPDNKRTADSKRANPPHDVTKADKFRKDWDRLSRSGRQDMHRLKEVMLLLIANDEPLPPEWKDHQLKGFGRNVRECHAKGDLLLVYRIDGSGERSVITFLRAGTHSEIFGR